MKNLIFPILLTMLVTSTTSAQDDIFYANLKKEDVPLEVLTSVKRDFKDGMATAEYRALPVELLNEDWFLNYIHNNMKNKYDIYEVSISGTDFKGHVTYDALGHMVSAVENITNIPLPHPIQRSIGSTFPGWGVSKDHEIISINKDGMQKIYYQLQLTKGNEEKNVVYDGNANLIKVNRKHKMWSNRLHNREMEDDQTNS